MQADSLPAEPPGKPKNTGVGSLSFLQEIFPTQELNWGLLHCRWILYHLSLILFFSPQLSSFPSHSTLSGSKYGGDLLQPLQPQSGPGSCQDPQGTFPHLPQLWDPLQDLVGWGEATSLPQPGVRPHRHRITPRKDSKATAQGLYEWRVRGLQGQGGESRADHFPLWSPHGCISGDAPQMGDAPHG